jgi:hypothetical protein
VVFVSGVGVIRGVMFGILASVRISYINFSFL